jgi:hypothetical protein
MSAIAASTLEGDFIYCAVGLISMNRNVTPKNRDPYRLGSTSIRSKR